MPFELHVALRYLLARRKQAFISVISLISTLGVTVGVTALIIALALMTGLQGELRDRILGAGAHVYAWKAGGLGDYRAEVARLRQVPGVVGAAPAIIGKAIVRTERADGFITLKGIDPELEAGVTDLDDSLNGLNLGAMTPFLSLLGLDGAPDPGEAVWNQATADAVRKARAQAVAIAEASGRTLGPVRYVSVLMRSHDGENALVSLAIRFGFEDQQRP